MISFLLWIKKKLKLYCKKIYVYLKEYPIRFIYARTRAIYMMIALLTVFWVFTGDTLSLNKLGVYFYCSDVFGNAIAGSDVEHFWPTWNQMNVAQFSVLSVEFSKFGDALTYYSLVSPSTELSTQGPELALNLLHFWARIIPFGSLSDLLLIVMIFPTSLGIYMICVYLVHKQLIPAFFTQGMVYNYIVERVARPRLDFFYDFLLSISKLVLVSFGEADASVFWLQDQWALANSVLDISADGPVGEPNVFILKQRSLVFKFFIQYHPYLSETLLYCMGLLVICVFLLLVVYYKPPSISELGVFWRMLCLVFFVSPLVVILLTVGSSLIHIYYLFLAALLSLFFKLKRWDESSIVESTWRWYLLTVLIYLLLVLFFSVVFFALSFYP